MADKSVFQGRSRADTELWILSLLEKPEALPLDEVLAVLAHFGSTGIDRRVDGWAERVLEALIARQDGIGTLRVLALRCTWLAHDRDLKALCTAVVERAFTSRLGKILVKNAGFPEAGISATEAVRRLLLLARLEKGVLCTDKTWGFGTVQRVDDFYARVTIDFDRKRGHEMALSYAAEALELLPVHHLLVRLHREKAAIRHMVKEEPAALVRLALESYGPLNVDALKAHLVGTVMEERDWKGFWEGVRKALKADPLVHLPPKRSDPIRLLESADAHIEQEFAAFAALREPDHILKKADVLEAAGLLSELSGDRRELLAERLAFAVWGAEDRSPALAARGLLTADRFGVTGTDGLLGARGIDVAAAYGRLLEGDVFLDVLHALPARLTAAFLDRVTTLFPERAAERLLAILPSLSAPVLQEALPRIRDAGAGDRLESFIRERLRDRNAGAALLYWLFRHPEEAAALTGGDAAELLRQGVDALEWPASGEMLKAQHLLRALYESGGWLSERLGEISAEQRTVFMVKLQGSRGWDETGRRSVIAGVIKAWPELQVVISGRPDANAPKPRSRMTSWRSYRERQEQFRRLTDVDIPENAREIAVARSYGDLRENAEFKYAKEHQRILYRRRDEMEQDLENVKGTDFANVATDVVGMGTEVVIQRPDGSRARYCILGEWDRDEGLNIISSLSQLAKQLEGLRPGERAELPGGAAGNERCEVVSVEGLRDGVMAWLQK
jgi:transcription elongation GreA/GreB family factor